VGKVKRKVILKELNKLMDEGLSQSEIARKLNVTRGLIWIYFWKKKRIGLDRWQRFVIEGGRSKS
jgi:hypothetical protein